MKQTIGLLFIFLLWGNFCRAEIRIMPLGDSITEGGYEKRPGFPTTEGSYRTSLVPRLLSLNSKLSFVGSREAGPTALAQKRHEGHSGWRVDELIAGRVYARSYERGIRSWLPTYNPDIILLMIGTNDILQNYFIDQAPLRFQKLIDEIQRLTPRATILIASAIPTNNDHLNAEIEKYNSEIHSFVLSQRSQGASIYWVDMYNEAKMSWRKGDFSDGVHPSALGYLKMADVWFNHVAPFVSASLLRASLRE